MILTIENKSFALRKNTMAKNLVTTNELSGVRVVGGKSGTKRIGKIRNFVFHPKEKRCIGFMVKRPDLLWMFRRKNKFVSIEGYDMIDGRIVIRNASDALDKAACKSLEVNWDDCVFWVGLPIMTEDGTSFGRVGNITFNALTGSVDAIESDTGATANALLGRKDIPADLIKGFHRGMGVALARSGQEGVNQAEEDIELGALLVSDEVKNITAEGGLAEKAGKTTAVVADKAGKAAAVASDKASKAAKKTGEVVNKGAYATGKQIGKTKGMFSGFKEEYDKARHDGDSKTAIKKKKK